MEESDNVEIMILTMTMGERNLGRKHYFILSLNGTRSDSFLPAIIALKLILFANPLILQYCSDFHHRDYVNLYIP